MEKSLAVVKTLEEHLSPFTKGQRMYLIYRVLGMYNSEALAAAKRKNTSERVWRYAVKGFRETTTYLVECKDQFRDEALSLLLREVAVRVLSGWVDLALKIEDWANLPKEDKQYVSMASKMFIQHLVPKFEGGSYDELILKRHVKR